MASAQPLDFAAMAPQIAAKLFDQPNKAMSRGTELRFGTHGSMSIDLEAGRFYDHEGKRGGGMLELIQHVRGCDTAAALSWLEDEGLKEREQRDAGIWQLAARQTGPIFYDYRDETGAIVSRVKRTPDKRFSQLGPDGRGGFHSAAGCMTGVRRVPYRLPELLAADAGRIVFVVEGEKDTDRLASLGFVATCNSEGAGKFRADLTHHFSGRRVVVIADNDTAGRDHAADVSAKLAGVAAATAILNLPGLSEKGDVLDWLDAGGTTERLKELARAAFDAEAVVEQAPSIPLVSATPYVWREPETIAPRDWLYGRWLLRGSVTAAIAPGGIGKTTFLGGTALALITGRELHGKTVWGGSKRVWIWNLEDSGDELARSLQAAAKHFDLCAADIGDRLFVDTAMDGNGLCTAVSVQGEVKILQPVFDALVTELNARRIDVLIVDPFVSSHEVDENDNGAIDKVTKTWSRVAKASGCCVILVHHTSKAGAAEVTALSGRGAVAMINACRSAIVFNRMTKEEAIRLGVDEDDHWRYFSVHDDKHNRAPAERAGWFRLESVDLGNGMGEDRPSDSLGVAAPWSAPSPFESVPHDALLRVQRAVAGQRCREHHLSPEWFGHVVASVLDLRVDRKADKARIQQMQRIWIENGVFKVVDGQDERRKPVRFVEVDRWANDTAAPPRSTGAEHTGATEHTGRSTTTRPPTGRGGGAGGAGGADEVEQNGRLASDQVSHLAPPRYPAGNPAFRPIADDDDPAADEIANPRRTVF